MTIMQFSNSNKHVKQALAINERLADHFICIMPSILKKESPKFESFSDITNSEKSKKKTPAPDQNCLEIRNELLSVQPPFSWPPPAMASGPFPHADALPSLAPLAIRAKY